MYSSLKIQNFRGFQVFEINDFKRINLITGMNDVGKTSLLEAIFLNAGKNVHLVIAINGFRGIDKVPLDTYSERPWNSIFYDRDTSKKVNISGNWKSKIRKIELSIGYSEIDEFNDKTDERIAYGKSNSSINASDGSKYQILKLEYFGKKREIYELRLNSSGFSSRKKPNLDFATYFYRSKIIANFEDAELFGKLDILSEIENITKILQIIEPRLRRLSVVVLNGEPIIHGDIGLSKLLPIPFMGEGLSRLLGITLRIANAKDGIVLIDEIENGFHFSVLERIWQAIDEVSKSYNVQIFTTTHSYECIKYANNTFSRNNKEDFAFFRLDRVKENILAKSFDADTLTFAFETETEVR